MKKKKKHIKTIQILFLFLIINESYKNSNKEKIEIYF